MHPSFRSCWGIALALLVSIAAPSDAVAQTTALFIDSQTGDRVGRGQQQTLTSPTYAFITSGADLPETVTITVRLPAASFAEWTLTFAAPDGVPLAPGVYENAARYPFQHSSANGLNVTNANGGGCNILRGRFVVREIVVSAHIVTRFAADFEQHCEGATPALFGAVRFNSTVATLVPFDGNYPLYGLQVTPAVNGYVTAPGIECGAGRTDCDELYPAYASVAVEAVALPGYEFVGWAGLDCIGAERVAVLIDRLKYCTAVFTVAPGQSGTDSPDYSDNAFVIDGYFAVAGVIPAGGRSRLAFISPDSVVSILTATTSEVRLAIDTDRNVSWQLTFGAARSALLAPGDFGPTASQSFSRGDEPILAISGGGLGSCSHGGRFTIHELEFIAGTLTAFSADFEAPCGSPARLTSGSIRYHSSRATLLPFGGEYPGPSLRITTTIGGFVTASGISCGDGGRADCEESFGESDLVPLEAIPSPGYDFLGWSGRCAGTSPLTLLVMDRSLSCIAIFHPSIGSAAPVAPNLGNASLLLDWVGSAQHPTRSIFIAPDASVTPSRDSSERQSFSFQTVSGSAAVSFGAPFGRLSPGEYPEAYTSPATGLAHLSVPGCFTFTSPGSFTVYQADYDASGTLVAFAADFEARCSDPNRPYVAGAVRFNSSLDTLRPYDGLYPRFLLAIVPSFHGTVTAQGIACGPGSADCLELYASARDVALHAIPATGYRFVGWTGACQGGSYTRLLVDRTRSCRAHFAAPAAANRPEDPALSNNALLLNSHPGSPFAGAAGRRDLVLDARMTVTLFNNRKNLDVHISHVDGRSWSLDFTVPTGEEIRPGAYLNAGRAGNTQGPGIDLSTSNPFGSCPSAQFVSGRFVIHEITFASPTSSTVTSLALDFEHRCSPQHPPTTGAIRFRSSQSIAQALAFSASSVPFDFTGDGGADFVWQNRTNGQLSLWHMSRELHTFNEPLAPAHVADTEWHIVGSADENDDGFPDLYWQHQGTGALAIWYMRGNALISGEALSPSVPDTAWKVRSVTDMDRDGHPDLIWQNTANGMIAVWFMNGRQLRRGEPIGTVADVNWVLVGAGDSNGDGNPDLFWHHVGSGEVAVWFMNGQVMLAGDLLSPARVPDTNWRLRGVADLDQNGSADLVWQHLTTLDTAVWFMNGRQLVSGRSVAGPRQASSDWILVTPR